MNDDLEAANNRAIEALRAADPLISIDEAQEIVHSIVAVVFEAIKAELTQEEQQCN